MILAAIIAYIVPFELFLFAYAVLGPLHYLTEISWLHDRKYFSTGKFDYLWLALPAVPITASFFVDLSEYQNLNSHLMWIAFGGAIGMAFFAKGIQKVSIAITFLLTGLLLTRYSFYAIFVATLLPTIIHVYVFTGVFILYGALRSKNSVGYASFAVFILCAVIFFVIPANVEGYILTEYVDKSIKPFMQINKRFSELFGIDESWAGIVRVMQFMAYAYTYHYLNWFSKTQVIRWHEISKSRMFAIILAWLISLGVYSIDYRFGYIALFFLSLLHVLLEFPLNHKSIVGIGEELAIRLKVK